MLLQLLSGTWLSIGDLGLAIVLLLAARAIQVGRFTVGDVALFSIYIWLVMDGPEAIGGFVADYRNQAVSINRMLELQPDTPAARLVEPGPVYMRGPFPGVQHVAKAAAHRLDTLEAAGLSYAYPNSGRGIDGIDLRLERGSFTVVAGRVGSGKTTLLRVLLAFCPCAGVRYDGTASLSRSRHASLCLRGARTFPRCRRSLARL